jgi:hypothetical protein
MLHVMSCTIQLTRKMQRPHVQLAIIRSLKCHESGEVAISLLHVLLWLMWLFMDDAKMWGIRLFRSLQQPQRTENASAVQIFLHLEGITRLVHYIGSVVWVG